MPRHAFASISKIPNVCGREDYISNPERQEYLYATYTTVERENFWQDLQEISEEQHSKYGNQGGVIAAREWIIALDESLVELDPNEVLRTFVDAFHEKYGVECTAALHHNKPKTNYHIHMIFSERKLLPEPTEKIASRNMFFDENGKHRRTKKEILDADGKVRKGCKIVAKGEAYEKKIFTAKDDYFKSIEFREEAKDLFLDINNSFIKDANRKLTKFDPDSVYLPTKKVGKNNPKAEYILAENDKRKEWNQTVDQALIGMVKREDILDIKEREIKDEIKLSFATHGYKPDMFITIVSKAIDSVTGLFDKVAEKVKTSIAEVVIPAVQAEQKHRVPPPVEPELAKQYDKLNIIYDQVKKHYYPIKTNNKTIEALEVAAKNCTSPFQFFKKRELERDIKDLKAQNAVHHDQQNSIIQKYGFKNIDSFMSEYYKAKNAKNDYNKAVIDWINHKDDSADAPADMKKTAGKEKAVDKPKAEKKVSEKKEPMSITVLQNKVKTVRFLYVY